MKITISLNNRKFLEFYEKKRLLAGIVSPSSEYSNNGMISQVCLKREIRGAFLDRSNNDCSNEHSRNHCKNKGD